MEIAAVVVGALLAVPFEKLIEKLALPGMSQVTSQEVRAQLKKWEDMLPMIQAALEDAEDQQITSRVVETWLKDLRDLVYDVDDVLDEFATEDLRLKQAAVSAPAAASASSSNKARKILPCLFTSGSSSRGSSSSKVRNFLPCLTYAVSESSSGGGDDVKFNYAEMGSILEELTARMEKICTRKSRLNLGDKPVGVGRGRSGNTTRDQRTETTSLPDAHVFGRDNDKQAILDMVLAGGAGVSVIPIQGMGGLGKTTLAQLVYNDERVKVHFELKAWVCVSDTFDISSITKTVLRYVGGGTGDGMTLDQLQVGLKNILSGKKFVIVLDDVWNENYHDWTVLYKPFEGGAPGSRIIVTTRNQEVARMMGTSHCFHGLGELSFDDCLSLFCQHALGASNFNGHQNLKETGEKIVRKCGGLPLAAKTLGGMLNTKLCLDAWVEILESQIWDLPNDILPALRLSYYHLPSHLKQCFAYCSIFPKDYEFDTDGLVQLWMAEGFLPQPKGKKHMEDVGVACFYDLLSRSFFQRSSSKSERFVMHDLIHDLAQCVAGDICFHLDSQLERTSSFQKVRRHSSFTRRMYEVSKRFEGFDEGKSLRSLLALPVLASSGYNCISNEVLNRLLSKKLHLRALSLSGYWIKEIPNSTNGLKHLRYLNLSRTAIRLLPEFVCSLLNLQTLLLRGCTELQKLPTSIGYLSNLCHLDISGTDKLKEMPVGIGNLTNLRVLGKFIVGVGGGDGLNIRELKGISHLKGELSIQGLHNVEDFQHAREADLKGKKGLESLVMEWSDKLNEKGDEIVAAEVLQSLQPYEDLKRLAIRSYYGRELPSWIGDPLLMSNMVELELYNCSESTSLPSLGRLPMLKHLVIDGMMAVKSVGSGFYGCDSAFLALETLKFKNMQGWEDWCLSEREGECIFPCLRFLEISECPSLVANGVVSLLSLCELKLEGCNASLLRCVTDITSIKTLSLGRMSGLSCLDESVDLGQLVSLEHLQIYGCEELTSLFQVGTPIEDKLTNLSSLEVSSCPQLVSFFTTLRIKKLVYLGKMIVRKCPKIGPIQMEQQEDGNDETGFPLNLRHVEVEDCGDQFIESIVNGLMMRRQCVVELLEIRRCDSIRHLGITSGRGGIKLKRLRISYCNNLVSLCNPEQGINSVEIEELEIKNCPSLTTDGMTRNCSVKRVVIKECNQIESLPEEWVMSMSTVFKDIVIKKCPNLERLPDSLHSLTNLTSLKLFDCDGIEWFPESGLPIPNLDDLFIENCRNLKSLPKNMHSLTSLERLMIWGCPGVEFITEEEAGCLPPPLPPNLRNLRIGECRNMKQSMSEWGLDKLTSLQWLTIEGLSDELREDEATLTTTLHLPTSLTQLWISSFNKVESITSTSWGIQNLTSLRVLSLAYFPKLRYLPKEGLPPTIEQLFIKKCPMVAKKCSEEKGKYWPRISLIPYIYIWRSAQS